MHAKPKVLLTDIDVCRVMWGDVVVCYREHSV